MARLRQRLGNIAQIFLESHLRNKANEEDDARAATTRRDLATYESGLHQQDQSHQFDLDAIKSAMGDPTGRIAKSLNLDSLVPSREALNAPTMKSIAEAKTPEDLGTMRGRFEEMRSSAPIRPVDLNDVRNLGDVYNQQSDKINQNQELAADQRAAGQYSDTYQQGQAKSDIAAQTAPQDIATANQTEIGTRKEKAASAGATAFAQSSGQAKGQDPFTEGSPYQDQAGSWHLMRRANGKLEDVPLPPGYVPPSGASTDRPQKLTAGQVDTLSSLNTAETEGVKVLTAMKTAGLDQSNDVMDPRWNTFAVGTLKISPADWNRADEVQRTQFVRAAILRSLMGARPSQYIAQIYNDHVPDSKQTGQQLFHVMNNVLEQVGSRRHEMENLTGNEPDKFRPSSGMTYEDWIKQAGPQNPTQGPDADPDIINFMQRPSR